MSPQEIFFCIFILLPIFPMLIYRQFRLASVFGAFYVCFGLLEWLSVSQTGKSISQIFWEFDARNPVGGWVIIGSMIAMWLALLFHLKGKNKK